MAVHGRYGQPCPVCGAPVQRIVYAAQRGQLLRRVPDRRHGCSSDRALSRLLKDDWPRTLDELEARRDRRIASHEPRSRPVDAFLEYERPTA